MGQIDFTQIPYSQHHREAAMMLGTVQCQSVFGFLLDEYMFRLRTNNPLSFVLSCNKISAACNLQWHTVNKVLQNLESNMKLISIKDNYVSLDGDRYMSLIYAFHKLSDKKKRTAFTKALVNNDEGTLEELGFVLYSNANNGLLTMNGGVLVKIDEPSSNLTNSEADTSSNLTNLSQKPRTLVKIDQPSSNLTNLSQNQRMPQGESSSFLTNLSQICRTHLVKFDEQSEAREIFRSIFDETLDENVVNDIENAIFDKNDQLSEEQGLVIFDQLLKRTLVKFDEGVSQNQRTEINNNKEEKNKTPEHEVFFTLGKVDTTFLDRDEELPEQKRHVIKNRTIFRTPEYPYFPEYKVLEFISDIHACADNGVKLFLYNFNQELHARFDVDEVRDEETGDIIRESSTDYHQFVIARSEFKDMVGRSIDDALEAIDTGYIYTDDNEKVEITATMEHPETLVNIIDWKFQLIGDGEECCEVDWGKIQNPDEEPLEDIQPVRFKRTKPGEVNQERENNRKFIARLLELGEDDDTWGTLTPMEKLVYNFLCDHFQFSDDGREVVDIKGNRYLNRNVILRFIVTEKESRPDTPSKEELFSVFSVDKPDMYGGITLRESMFSAAKIQRWNKKHGLQGIVVTSDDKTTTEQ